MMSRLQPQFVGDTFALHFKSEATSPARRLPFYAREHEDRLSCFWAVPAVGGYTGGNETGCALAALYLKHLRDHRAPFGGLLHNVVLDMVAAVSDDRSANLALRGQIVGFFCELESWLDRSIHFCGRGLDGINADEMLALANAGLNFDEDAYFDSMHDKEDV